MEKGALTLLRPDGQPLPKRSPAPLHSRILKPLPNGTTKTTLLGAAKWHGAVGTVDIFPGIGGLVRFPSVDVAKAAEAAAKSGRLHVRGEKVTMQTVDERQVFCTDLSPDVSEEGLRVLFEEYGTITNITLGPERILRKKLSRVATVTFERDSVADVIHAKNGTSYHGRALRLFFGNPEQHITPEVPMYSSTNKSNAFDSNEPPPSVAADSADLLMLQCALVAEVRKRIGYQRRAFEDAASCSRAEGQHQTVLAALHKMRSERESAGAHRYDECERWKNLYAESQRVQKEEAEKASHALGVAESRRKMTEMDLETWKDKERAQRRRAEVAEHKLQDVERVERERAEKMKAEAEKRKAEAERLAEEAERLRRKKENDRRAKEQDEQRRAREAEEQRQIARRAAAVKEETRCEQRDARWPPAHWSYPAVLSHADAKARFLVVCKEFDNARFSDERPLVVRSVPWPVLAHPTVFEVHDLTWDAVERFLGAVRTYMSQDSYREFLKNARLRFHPNRWAARGLLQSVIDDDLRETMKRACETVSQVINSATSELEGR